MSSMAVADADADEIPTLVSSTSLNEKSELGKPRRVRGIVFLDVSGGTSCAMLLERRSHAILAQSSRRRSRKTQCALCSTAALWIFASTDVMSMKKSAGFVRLGHANRSDAKYSTASCASPMYIRRPSLSNKSRVNMA